MWGLHYPNCMMCIDTVLQSMLISTYFALPFIIAATKNSFSITVVVLLYSPIRPVVDISAAYLWLMAVATVICASLWSNIVSYDQNRWLILTGHRDTIILCRLLEHQVLWTLGFLPLVPQGLGFSPAVLVPPQAAPLARHSKTLQRLPSSLLASLHRVPLTHPHELDGHPHPLECLPRIATPLHWSCFPFVLAPAALA
ncbi:hypothetical protein IEQ34_000335 [Dendrobium chrysotoxum]|uniref:Uncharacterized protein n=1 Tax=Dendrobium chrysotoxum TaxID=161865 RepID=A0AAV7HSG9_DENCH|nr:hypothetical protein IEQ34_000335 [Dendrobium chrysotoxum]